MWTWARTGAPHKATGSTELRSILSRRERRVKRYGPDRRWTRGQVLFCHYDADAGVAGLGRFGLEHSDRSDANRHGLAQRGRIRGGDGASRTQTGDLLGAISALSWPEFSLTSRFPSLRIGSPNIFPNSLQPVLQYDNVPGADEGAIERWPLARVSQRELMVATASCAWGPGVRIPPPRLHPGRS